MAYLASHQRRAAAVLTVLKETIGTRPEQILAVERSALAKMGKAGILPDISAKKLLTIAKIAYEGFDGDLRPALKKPLPQAKKALKKFPSIGDPGAEKILLFTRSYPVMALDSNGLRVLCRVGFAEEQKNPATYRLVQNAIREQLPQDYDSLIRAHQLLHQHGQELCKRSKPRCAECPVRTECAYNRNAALSHRSRTVLLSPVIVLVLGNAAARISGHLWGVWSWIPVILVYWSTLAAILGFAGGWTSFRHWLQPSQGAWGWRLLSFATTALFIPVFLLNFPSLNQPWVISSWLAVAIIDPWLEEGYWRGLLMDASSGWPGWLVIVYTTVWFGLSHPLLLGVNVKALSGLPGFFGTVFTGTIWSTVYWKTRSLRWPIFSHFVVDLLSVSVLVFLNRAALGK